MGPLFCCKQKFKKGQLTFKGVMFGCIIINDRMALTLTDIFSPGSYTEDISLSLY